MISSDASDLCVYTFRPEKMCPYPLIMWAHVSQRSVLMPIQKSGLLWLVLLFMSAAVTEGQWNLECWECCLGLVLAWLGNSVATKDRATLEESFEEV